MPVLSHAGVEDFNTIIEENEKAEKQLQQNLRKQLNTVDLEKIEHPNFKATGEAILGKTKSTENVAVGTAGIGTNKKKTKTSNLEKNNFKRISEEIKEVQ